MIAHRHDVCKHFCLSLCLWCTYLHCSYNEIVPVTSLQLSAVVQLPMLLHMVNEVALVQPLDPQWTTPVTQGTPCKETTDIPAWPTNVGVGGHLLAIVSCSQSNENISTHTWTSELRQRNDVAVWWQLVQCLLWQDHHTKNRMCIVYVYMQWNLSKMVTV